MAVLAIICSAAGTWQIFRFEQKRSANHHLRTDNDDRPVSVLSVLGPASAPTSNGDQQKFRHITATGTYLPQDQTLLRGQTVNGDIGYVVLTPLRTDGGVLLVARGFITQTGAAQTSPVVPAAPTGDVTVTARLEPADSRADRFGQLPGSQVDTVYPADQQARIGSPVWNGYAELLDGQPGAAGLTVIPDPDMSNPAGGAIEPQHAAYILQWYVFAILALSAPFILARADRRREEADALEQGIRPDAIEPGQEKAGRKEKKASLDDRLAGKA